MTHKIAFMGTPFLLSFYHNVENANMHTAFNTTRFIRSANWSMHSSFFPLLDFPAYKSLAMGTSARLMGTKLASKL